MGTIIENIKKYLEENCPLFAEARLGTNCLAEKAGSVAVKAVPCDGVLKSYADGGVLGQFLFDICLRTAFDNDESDNSAAASFMERLEEWIYLDADAKMVDLPQSVKGAEFETVKTYGVKTADRSGAEYSMRVRLIYEK